MNTTENNKLIAEFMGVFDKILSTGNIHSWSDAPFYYTTEDTKEKVIQNITKYLKYHKDWNSIMQVVEKIESLDEGRYYITITYKACRIKESWYKALISESIEQNTTIEAVYNACVTFIEWYNQQS